MASKITIIPDYDGFQNRAVRVSVSTTANGKTEAIIATGTGVTESSKCPGGVALDEDGIMALIEALLGGKHG